MLPPIANRDPGDETDECIATFEAVLERIEEGDTGCPLCGRRPDEHAREEWSR